MICSLARTVCTKLEKESQKARALLYILGFLYTVGSYPIKGIWNLLLPPLLCALQVIFTTFRRLELSQLSESTTFANCSAYA